MAKSEKIIPEIQKEDHEFLNELRPHIFNDFVGQEKTKKKRWYLYPKLKKNATTR